MRRDREGMEHEQTRPCVTGMESRWSQAPVGSPPRGITTPWDTTRHRSRARGGQERLAVSKGVVSPSAERAFDA